MFRCFGDPARLHLGQRIGIPGGPECGDVFVVTNSGEVWIGDDCVLGYDVYLLCGHHDYTLRGQDRHPYPRTGYDIRIGNGVWIASRVTVVGPCAVGDDAVLAAGSVVVGDVPAGELWGGNPARLLKKIAFR